MRAFVNGEPVDFQPSDAQVEPMGDRLAVRIGGQLRTAAAVKVGESILVSYLGHRWTIETKVALQRTAAAASGELRATMPGSIVDVLMKPGDKVSKGDKILVLEAMKTQQPFVAPFDGSISSIPVSKGQQVDDGAVLAVVDPSPSE